MKQFFQTAARTGYARAAVMVLVVACLLVSVGGVAQSDAIRSVEGKVYGPQSAPLGSAVRSEEHTSELQSPC